MDHIASVINDFISAEHITGAAVRVYKKNERVYDQVFGFADLEKKMPVTANTMYRMCSMTKPITGICVMKLVEEGRLSLQDPVAKFIPEIRDMHVAVTGDDGEVTLVPLKRDITIYDCLNHSSGIGTGPIRPSGGMATASTANVLGNIYPGMPLEERVKLYAQGPADFQPGEGTGYSAFMAFDILAYVIGCASGMDFNTYLQKAVAGPMGIRDLTFTPDEEQLSRLGPIIGKNEGRLFDETETSMLWLLVDPMKCGYHSGGAGILGSLEAYSAIAKMLLDGGVYNGVRVLKEETVRLMSGKGTNLELRFEEEAYWGLSLANFDRPERMDRGLEPGSFGWSGAYGTHFYIDPKNEMCVILMTCGSYLGGADSDVSWVLEKAVYDMFIR